jgi:hypothetical protein
MADIDRPAATPSVRLFSELPEANGAGQQAPADASPAAMRRLREPFDAEKAEKAEKAETSEKAGAAEAAEPAGRV